MNTGCTTLQRLCRIGYGESGQFFCFNRRDRTGQIRFFDCTITDYNHLIQILSVFAQLDCQVLLIADLDLLIQVTNIGNLQRCPIGNLQREVSLKVGNGSVGGSLNYDVSTDHRLAILIDYLTRDALLLLSDRFSCRSLRIFAGGINQNEVILRNLILNAGIAKEVIQDSLNRLILEINGDPLI